MRADADAAMASLADKVAFLSRPEAYPVPCARVDVRETHMSWVFLAGERVYKLKKPVRFPYLDFSTLARRESACRTEHALNRRLAVDVYLGVVPLTASAAGLAIGGAGQIVDWLVVMRRLDEADVLERAIAERSVTADQIDRLVDKLAAFYRHATPARTDAAAELSGLRASLAFNRRVLLEPRLGLPGGVVRPVDGAQQRFLATRAHLIAERVRRRRIVDGHGDLRPEHVWLDDGIRIIDCLEFNARLRQVDPLDEIAYLGIECERLGASWIGERVLAGLLERLHERVAPELILFYRCHRASLRARLAIAHLLDPHPRTPEKWPRVARAYLRIAARDAAALERLLRTPRGR